MSRSRPPDKVGKADRAGPGRSRGGQPSGRGSGQDEPGAASRRLAIEAMIRIETGGAYANLVLPAMLDQSDLSGEDRRFVTELVYGTTRMKRACDHLVDRFLLADVDPQVRAALRIGAYQLAFLSTPDHAAVAATVGAVNGKGRSVVNAVLRKVVVSSIEYPDQATALSYPDWLVEALIDSLGQPRATEAMEAMNRSASTTVRADGYVQDEASQLVVKAVEVEPDHLVVDLCAAPGGKATALAATGATVIAGDRRMSRVGLIVENARRLDSPVVSLVADGRAAPVADGVADRVLVDAPCSGFGSLRRRPDARWRIEPEAPPRLAVLQGQLIDSAVRLLKPGGVLVYSVCTFGVTEGAEVIGQACDRHDLERLGGPGQPWEEIGGLATLVPGRSDGMMLARLRRRGA